MSKLTDKEKHLLYMEVYPIAQEYRRSFISDDKVINDTFSCIEQLGFLLLRFPAIGQDDSLSGFTIHKEPYDCIYINSRQSVGRQYTSCWHEVYHIITGESNGISYINKIKQDPIECKADMFASFILMPDKLVNQYIDSHNLNLQYLSHVDIIKMQNYFKVSYSAMLTRILQLYPDYKDILGNRYGIAYNNEEKRRQMKQKVAEAGGDIRLVTPSNDVYFPHSYIENIEYNLNNGRISKEKAFEMLSMLERLGNDL